jgi:beta-glucosidase
VAASVSRPVKELRGFARVHVPAGERRRVTFRLAVEQLAFTGVDGRLIIEPGRHVLMAGTSSADLPLQAEVEVRGHLRELPARSRFFSAVEVR